MSHTIELKNVSKYYAGDDSISMGISRVDLELDIGEFVAITGESGSGKSTLLNVISGLDTYEEGEMFVCGEDTTAYGTEDYENYRKTYIGNIFQDFNLINSYTVYQNIEAVMLLSGKKKKECKKRVNRLIDLVGLSEYRNTKASKLSGGQKQRVAIARALAKDSPIIVADEPTGNLDSVSAESVMETLAKVSKDKLVVIVTHNYEQAEPYVTRKLTMHDGSIIEDKKIKEPDADPAAISEIPAPGKMRKSSEVRLGIRNSFNLPAKFILLFIVYIFASTAVLGQYAATMNSMYESDLLGTNPHFTNTNPKRMIVKKTDGSSFTDDDLAAIRSTPNVGEVIKNDIAIDRSVSMSIGNIVAEGPVVPIDLIRKDVKMYGHMPENDYEIVVRLDAYSGSFIGYENNADEYIDRPVVIKDINQSQKYEFAKQVKVAGIIVEEDQDETPAYALDGSAVFYAGEEVCNELQLSMAASVSETEMDFGGKKVKNEYGRAVFMSPEVPDGEAYILDDQTYYYDDEEAVGKALGLKVKNQFFESGGEYEVGGIITGSNCKELAGISKSEFDNYFNCVFISTDDFKKLLNRGIYQISVFMVNEQDSDATQASLNEKGYTTLPVKEALLSTTENMGGVLDFMTYARLALEFIALFLIVYAVIRLIMRSRNSYYSTLRMLGASKSNTDNILRVELVFMMVIAYGIDVLFAFLINQGVLQRWTHMEMKGITRLVYYLSPADYIALGIVMLLMSIVIAERYSSRIFTRSAMKAFREGV